MFEKMLAKNASAETWAGAGVAYQASGDFSKAIECFQKSIDANSTLAKAWKGLANIYNNRGEYEKTIQEYQRASMTNPTSSWVYTGLGDVYLSQGHIDRAIEAYKTAIALNPVRSWAWTSIANAYRVNGQYDEAVDAFQKSIELLRRDSWPWKGLADSYQSRRQNNKAITVLLEAIETLPIDYSLQISAGHLYKESGDYTSARECYGAALKRCPDTENLLWAFLHLPTSHLFSDRPVIVIDEQLFSSFLWISLAEVLNNTGEQHRVDALYDEAISAYESALQNGPANHLLWCYSSYLGSLGLDVFENKKQLPIEVLWTILGEAYRLKGNYLKAIHAYETAARIVSSNKWLSTTLAELYKIFEKDKSSVRPLITDL